tara:strand:- start:14 stop:388 length:375 start_codon:yes stop_codon:yes gene_type:complete
MKATIHLSALSLLFLCNCKTTEEYTGLEPTNQEHVSLGESKKREVDSVEAYLAGYSTGIEVGIESGARLFGTAWRVPSEFYSYQEEWIRGINLGMIFVYNKRHPGHPIDLSQLEVQPDGYTTRD